MFKYWSIKKYGTKLLPILEKQFGPQQYYTASQVRSTVYLQNFDPKYLPLGYMLFVDPFKLNALFTKEFPQINILDYKREILFYLDRKSYKGYLKILKNITAC